MKRHNAFRAALLLAVSAMLAVGCSGSVSRDPLTVTVWTYYNGDQLMAFQALVDEYNETVGKSNNVVVVGNNLGSVNDLQEAVLNSANGKIGAEPMPNVFMSYADTAYAVDQMGLLAELSPYLTPEERDQYVEGYLEEGTLGGGDSVKIFPIAKSVEVLTINKTDFEPFAQATGTTYDDLKTFEGITEVAQRYYEWTDAQTPEPNDGRAFLGRDSLANYFFIGAKQLGCNLVTLEGDTVTVDFDKEVVRKLWDNYYIPFVKGYFDATGRYRSDDIKTGNIISLIGSSSGATFFPTQVVGDDGIEYDIEMEVLPCPQFEGGNPVAVQQGAGMAVINKSEEDVAASIDFLEWFTAQDKNLKFSIMSGYLPVTKQANSIEAVRSAGIEVSPSTEMILDVAMKEVADNELYTPPAFENGTAFRNELDYSFADLAAADSASVRDAISKGASYEEAIAPYISDEYFDAWYDRTLRGLEALAS